MILVAGVDSSTQSTTVVVADAETGKVIRRATAPHPDGTEVDPGAWEQALQIACAGGLLDGVAAIAVGGQQHGMVVLDAARRIVRPALLWNDVRSASAASDLIRELGGPPEWAQAVGLVPVAGFTVTKLRWLAQHEPAAADLVDSVVLPHDWVTARLLGGAAELVTDRGEASGTGYWSPGTGAYRSDLLVRAFGRPLGTPRVLAPSEPAGETSDGVLVAAGTGDNMAAALGLGIGPGDVVVSIGTSGTAFAVSETPVTDPSGHVAGFADATGRYLPLVATLNAARVLTATAHVLGTDLDGLAALALDAAPGAEGLVMLPYLDGERTPDLPTARGSLHGMTRSNMTPPNLARAAVEGILCGLADAVDALARQGAPARRVLLIGGGARSTAVRALAAGLFGASVVVPTPEEYVARGAARQAAWALSGLPHPPDWPVAASSAPVQPEFADGDRVRAAYHDVRDAAMAGLS